MKGPAKGRRMKHWMTQNDQQAKVRSRKTGISKAKPKMGHQDGKSILMQRLEERVRMSVGLEGAVERSFQNGRVRKMGREPEPRRFQGRLDGEEISCMQNGGINFRQ